MLEELFAAVRASDGREPLSDHKYLSLDRAEGVGLIGEVDGVVVAYAHVLTSGSGTAVELVVHPDRRSVAAAEAMLDAALAAGGASSVVKVWAFDPTQVEALLGRGARLVRQVAQLRRPLPPDRPTRVPPGVEFRPFVVGSDEPAWLELNNEAFAGHPENGGWDVGILTERMAQQWFDRLGLLMAWDSRALAGFCWTKLHPGRVGEIYIIAVAPSAGGRGIGRELATAALWDLTTRRGATSAMLYAEVDNDAGRALYRSLGFEEARVESCYEIAIP